VKPAPFDYLAPRSLDEALALLAERAPDARPLAGGQSLVPLMNLRLARPECLVDLGRVPELRYVRRDDGLLRIGAMATHLDVEESALLAECCPVLPAAARLVGHLQIRARGTLGGSVAHADPAAEWPMVLTAFEAQITVRSARGERTLTPYELFVGDYTTSLEPDELVTEIQIPVPAPGHGWAIQEVARRHGDFALVAATALVTSVEGRVGFASLALCGVGSAPVLARPPGLLAGQWLDEVDIRAVARETAAALQPESDLHAPAEYRREVAEVLCARALNEALARARGGDTA